PQAQAFDLQDGAAAARGFEELEAEAPAPAREQIDLALGLGTFLLQALDLRQLHLCLARHLLRRGSEAGDEAPEPLDVAAGRTGESWCRRDRRLPSPARAAAALPRRRPGRARLRARTPATSDAARAGAVGRVERRASLSGRPGRRPGGSFRPPARGARSSCPR